MLWRAMEPPRAAPRAVLPPTSGGDGAARGSEAQGTAVRWQI